MPLSEEYLKQLIFSPNNNIDLHLIDILRCSIQNNDNEKLIISLINQQLPAVKTRLKGLTALNSIISYCSLSTLTDNALNWVTYCTVGRETEDNSKQIKLELLSKIVENTYNVPNFNKTFVSNHISDVLKSCLSAKHTGEELAALNCLSQCMQRYGSWFGNHQPKVEAFLLKHLESSDQKFVKTAAIAFHYFHQTGPAGVNADNYTNNFFNQYKRLCGTVHLLYDSFLDGTKEINQTEKIDTNPIEFQPIPAYFDSQQTLNLTAQKLTNCLEFLKVMIIKKYSAPKKIVPKYLVDVINRGLTLHVCLSKENISIEMNCLSGLLTKIQIKLLELFRLFINGHLTSLLPFSYTLTTLLVNVYKRTQDCNCFIFNNLYRGIVCKILNDWIRLVQSGFTVQLQENLFKLLLKEIIPDKTVIVLNVNNVNLKKSSNAKRKRHTVVVEEALNNSNNTDPLYVIGKTIKENNCIQALDILDNLLIEIDLKLSDKMLQSLYKFVITTLLDIQASKIIAPYTNVNCQVQLYKILNHFYEQKNTKQLPSIEIVIEILRVGSTNSNQKISLICNQGLENLEKICQPICPSLDIPNYYSNKEIENEINEDLTINSEEEEQNESEQTGEEQLENVDRNSSQNLIICEEPPEKKIKTSSTFNDSKEEIITQLKSLQTLLSAEKTPSSEDKAEFIKNNESLNENIDRIPELESNKQDMNESTIQNLDDGKSDDGLNDMLDAFENLVED